jgi:hypothetical protein
MKKIIYVKIIKCPHLHWWYAKHINEIIKIKRIKKNNCGGLLYFPCKSIFTQYDIDKDNYILGEDCIRVNMLSDKIKTLKELMRCLK